ADAVRPDSDRRAARGAGGGRPVSRAVARASASWAMIWVRPRGLRGRPGVAEQVVSRLEFEAGEDRDQRTAALRAERDRRAPAPGGAGLRERVLVGAHGKNVVEWYREEA